MQIEKKSEKNEMKKRKKEEPNESTWKKEQAKRPDELKSHTHTFSIKCHSLLFI